ncbi:hypothetical protein ACFOY2_48975 [Nonomuraea purpurea]|uniref:Uncharacterized protein n=1 Tax=Nonomuraea purpurea TaxID=1849276 RepID=A0ABV8GN47_9ACTN
MKPCSRNLPASPSMPHLCFHAGRSPISSTRPATTTSAAFRASPSGVAYG